MKLRILLVLFVLGAVTCDAQGWDSSDSETESGSGSGSWSWSRYRTYDDEDIHVDGGKVISKSDDDDDGDRNDKDDGDKEDDNGDDDNNDTDFDYEFECDHFNLEICMHDYGNFEDFDAPHSDDPLCWESYTTMQCLHDYARVCFPDSQIKEDYLCKIKYFQDRIQLLCLNETNEYDAEKAAIQEAAECVEGVEEDAEACVEETVPKISDMIKENNIKPDKANLETMKCMIMLQVMECTADRLKERCDEELVEAFKEGAQEGLDDILDGACKGKTLASLVP